jgi:ankyrin repeat protein
MVKLLIQNGADVNIPNSKAGETALHYAVRLGRKDLMKILLCAGADLDIRDTVKKLTPYDLAIETNQEEVKNTLQAVMGKIYMKP